MSITLLIINFSASRFFEDLTVIYAKQTIAKIVDNIDYILRDADRMTLNILMDEEIYKALAEDLAPGSYKDLTRSSTISKKLKKTYIYSYGFSAVIHLIYEDGKVIISTSYNNEMSKVTESDWYRQNSEKKEDLIILPTRKMEYNDLGIANVITLIRKYKNVNSPQNTIGHIIVDVNVNDVVQTLGDINKSNVAYIIDANGEIVSNNNKGIGLNEVIGENYYKLLTMQDGVFSTKVNNVSSYVIFGTSEFSGWKVIRIIPYSELMKNAQLVRNLIFILGIAGILAAILVSIITSSGIIRPLTALRKTMGRVEKGDLEVRFETRSNDEIKLLSNGFNGMLNEINNLMEEALEKEREKREAMLYSLQSQINPHFLYNTLNSIRYLADNYNAEDIKETVTAFINLLRTSISNPNEFINIDKELENIKSYVKIQQLRYGESFKVVYNIDEGVLACGIPKLIIQPILENAIFHGIVPKKKPGTILVKVRRNDEGIIISVIDDGVGLKNKEIGLVDNKATGEKRYSNIGMKNVHDRIRLCFGEKYGIRVFSLWGCGTDVEMVFPARIFDGGGESNVKNIVG